MNRVKTKVSDDGSVNVSWTYDGGTYGLGRLTSVISPAGDTSYGYDAQGRVTASNQTSAGNSYSFGYSYNAAGALTGETYPSGRVVTSSYDALDRATSVSGSRNGSTTNYATVRAYQPHGGIAGFSYGNALVTEQTYDRRLRPNSDYAAFYNSPDRFVLIEDRVWSGSGHVQSSNLYEGGLGPFATLGHFTQSYSHDGIDRLTGVSDSGGYSRTFGYDQYGNLSVTGSNGVPWSGLTPYSGDGSNPFSAGNNRLNAGGYDAAGNQTVLGSLQIGYDAENRQSLAQDGSDGAAYSYDGNGNRVGTGGPTIGATVYVYDAFGRLAAEYRYGAAAAAPCQTCYLTTDYLGSVRAVTSETLQVVGRHDYLPFGEEIPAHTAGRDGSFGAFDGIQQRFTGKERDGETVAQLDFSEARYYGAVLGRFTSPDPLNAGADLLNPQSWNGYSYVVNNPLSLIDPTGLGTCPAGSENTCVDVNSGPPEPLDTYSFCFVFSCGNGGFDFGLNRGGESGQQGQPPPLVLRAPQKRQTTNNLQQSCVVPSLLQQAGIAIQAAIASFSKKTIGFGVGGSIGAGNKLGVSLSISRQIVVGPNGGAAFATSVSTLNGQIFNSVTTKGYGGYGGFQFSISNASNVNELGGSALNYGIGGGGGYGGGADFATDLQTLQTTFTLGGGFGGYGRGLQSVTTAITPICGN